MMVIESPAKLTLTLSVVGVRDDGYHLIDAEMVALTLTDVITISDSPDIDIRITGPYATGIAVDETNLVHKALRALGRTARVEIQKNIPHGGGLGGGSSNAAAIFRWAHNADMELAASLGADVPFSIVGGRARVQGIGERVGPLEFEQRDITLFIPPVHTPTPLVYRTWDDMGGPSGNNGNDLEPAAVVAVPELAHWREKIADAIGREPNLAGSGSTWFAMGHIALDDAKLPELQVVHTTTRPDAGRVVEHHDGEI